MKDEDGYFCIDNEGKKQRDDSEDDLADCDPSGQGCKACPRYMDDCDGDGDDDDNE